MDRPSRRQTMAMLAASTAIVPMLPLEATGKPKRLRALPCPIATPIDAVADALLALSPEMATYNGVAAAIGGGPLARRMDDYSPAGEAAWRQALADQQSALKAARAALPPDCAADHLAQVRYDVAEAILESGTRSGAIPYGRPNPFWFFGHLPYLVTQISGPHIDTANTMQGQQAVSSVVEVDAWIEKLDSFPKGFAGVVEKLRADEAAGCRPPAILLEKALPVIDAFLTGPVETHPLITALAERSAAAGIDARAREAAIKRATTSLQKRARPAYRDLREQVAEMVPRGRAEAGVWAQPEGEALYAANVRSLGDTPLSPDEIHRVGLNEVARITAQMDGLLRKIGLTKGSVGQRMEALARDPATRFEDSDRGRAQALDQVRAIIAAMEARQPLFLPTAMIPRQKLQVRRVPPATEASAPGAYYDSPALDGSRPGIYWLNLRDMAAVPRFGLASVSYHEGVPGHHTQSAIALSLPEAPLLIRMASFNAYSEGWALYAERLAAELGAYRGDPKGDLNRLQEELARAVRLVVDTGMHALRWDREKAIAYRDEITGAAMTETVAEIERYMAWPGQALGYKLGQMRILAQRERARAALGKRYDLRSFHAAVLGQGAVPLAIVDGEITRLIGKK